MDNSELLRKKRQEYGIDEETLSRHSKISVRTIRRIEEGSDSPSVATKQKIIKALNQKAKELGKPEYNLEDIFPSSGNNTNLYKLLYKYKSDTPDIDLQTVIERHEILLINEVLERNKAVLLTGLGGMGKTTLAKLYSFKYREKYQEIFYLDSSFFLNSTLQVKDLKNTLNNIQMKCLIIIDDIDGIHLEQFSNIYDSINKNWHLFLISRTVTSNTRLPIINIQGLNLAEAHQLIEKKFDKHYRAIDRSEINELLRFVSNNPLAINIALGLYEKYSYSSFKEFRNHLVHNLHFTLDIANKPVEIYLDSNDQNNIKNAYKTITDFINNKNLVVEKDLPAEEGSWFKRFFVKTKNIAESEGFKEKKSEVEYGIKLHTITKHQSEVDKNQAEAVSKIIESIKDIPNAAIKIGSLLIVKITVSETPSISAKNLSLKELMMLENTPSLLKNPVQLLENLNQANNIFAIEEANAANTADSKSHTAD